MSYPICLFVYNRFDETVSTVRSLQKARGAQLTDIYIFSDGPKGEKDRHEVESVRKFIRQIDGFANTFIFESPINNGLAKSIISGVSKVFESNEGVIVLEDDLIVTVDFIEYMNNSLNRYKDNKLVFSISGFGLDVGNKEEFDNYFWERAHSWGWATWSDRWCTVNWDREYLKDLMPKLNYLKMYQVMGSDFYAMCKKFVSGEINSWYVRFALNQYMQGRITSYPFFSKVINTGFSSAATHCKNYNRYKIRINGESEHFVFSENHLNNKPGRRCRDYFSISSRAYGKIMTILMRFGLVKNK